MKTKSIEKKEKFCINPPAIHSFPKKPELCVPWLSKPIMLKPKIYWKITSKATMSVTSAAETKKYLKFKISNSLKR